MSIVKTIWAFSFMRYGLVGIVSNIIAYGLYIFITYYGVEPKIAMTIVYVIGASVGYVGNRKLTFFHSGDINRTIIRYIFAHFSGYILNYSILYIFVDRYGFVHQWVQALAIIFGSIFLFLIFKHCVFNGVIRKIR